MPLTLYEGPVRKFEKRMAEKQNPFESPAYEADAYSANQSGGSLIRSVFAVLLGGIVIDFLGTELVNRAIAFALGFNSLDSSSVSMAYQSGPIRILFLVCGVLCSFFGGMTAAWIARRRHILHALLSVLVAHAFVLPQFVGGTILEPFVTIFVTGLCFVAAAYAGKMVAPSKTLPAEE